MPTITLLAQRTQAERVFTQKQISRLQSLGTFIDARFAEIAEVTDRLEETEYLVGTWGMPTLDENFLAHMPRLRGVFYGAGSVKGFVTDALWARNIVVSSAAPMNALPVAEYTLAMILLSNKRTWQTIKCPGHLRDSDIPGNYHTIVGIIGASMVGKAVMNLLRHLDMEVLLSDPFVTAEQAQEFGARKVELPELMAESDVVSLHAPNLPSLRHMINGELLAKMKDGATFINTARGALVDEKPLIDELRSGRIWAVLDVTDPEPPLEGSPLYTLPNVVLTPHIAGSLGGECHRMGDFAISELERFMNQQPLQNQVTPEQLSHLA